MVRSMERASSPFTGDREFLPLIGTSTMPDGKFTIEGSVCRCHAGAGRLRTCQVSVGDFVPRPYYEVPAAMEAFVEWLNRELASWVMPIHRSQSPYAPPQYCLPPTPTP
uniref:Uncharacterized protein n=1 Tax=Globodera pallida TaxID=36090 RepID=A0A183CNN2_GLOPA